MEPRGRSCYLRFIDHESEDNDQRHHASQTYPPAKLEEPDKLFRKGRIFRVEGGHKPFDFGLARDIAYYPDKTGEDEQDKAQGEPPDLPNISQHEAERKACKE